MSVTQSGDMTAAFESALAEGASPAPEVETQSPEPGAGGASADAATTETATTAQSAEATQTPEPAAVVEPEKPVATPTAGEPPAWRWQDILANAREQASKDAEARIRAEYEWANSIQPEARSLAPQALALAQWLERDPAGATAWIVEQTGWKPAAATPQVDLSVEPGPDAAVELPDGSTVPVYTAEGQARREAWLRAQIDQRLQPMQSIVAERQAQEQAEQQRAQATAWATDVISPIKALPFFDEFKGEIAKVVQGFQSNLTQEQMRDAVRAEYTRLHTAKIEAITKGAETTAIATLRQRAAAGGVNPTAPGAMTSQKFTRGERGFAEALAHFSNPT